MSKPEMIEALHPDPDKQGTRVTKSIYDAYRAALLSVIPATEEGGTLWVPIALGVAATALALAGVLVWQSRRRLTVA